MCAELQSVWYFTLLTSSNRLACYSLMDGCRRQKIPGSETENFITHCKHSIQSFMFAQVLAPSNGGQEWVPQMELNGYLHMQHVVL